LPKCRRNKLFLANFKSEQKHHFLYFFLQYQKVLLFGASGHLGFEIAKVLIERKFEVTAVVRNAIPKIEFLNIPVKIADATKPETLVNICEGYDIVISSLGKSVAMNDRSKPSFYDVDFVGNSNILAEAQKAKVQKFVYISAFQAEKFPELTYFKVHEDFSQKLQSSGIDFSIIKPPAIFSAFLEFEAMAKKGFVMSIGSGNAKTNPISETDLAQVCVDSISQINAVIEAGGQTIYSRKGMLEIIQNAVDPTKTVKTLPIWFVKMGLPYLKFIDKNTFDKFAFFVAVLEKDTLAPKLGKLTFEEYWKTKTASSEELTV
jgi:uncharacterized protein YbjT (DUF2867 family)